MKVPLVDGRCGGLLPLQQRCAQLSMWRICGTGGRLLTRDSHHLGAIHKYAALKMHRQRFTNAKKAMLDHFIKYLAAYQPSSQVQDDQSQEEDQPQQDTFPKHEDSESEDSEPEEKVMEYVYPRRRRARVDRHLVQRRRRSSYAPMHPPHLPMSLQYWMPQQHPMSPPLVSVPAMFQPQPWWMVANGRPMPPGPFWPSPAAPRFPYV